VPFSRDAHGRRREVPAAERHEALHHGQQYEPVAERAPLGLGQRRAGEDAAGVILRETRKARPSANSRPRGRHRRRPELAVGATSSLASGSESPLSVRASGPSSSSHAETWNGVVFSAFSGAVQVMPIGPFVLSPPGNRAARRPP